MSKQPKPGKYFDSPLARVLREHLEENAELTQIKLAQYLNLDERTLRRYKNGEVLVTNVYELKRIADLLGIEPERLGVLTLENAPLTVKQIDEQVEQVWSLINEARISEARWMIENVLQKIHLQTTTISPVPLHSLAHVYHAAGHATSLSVRTDRVDQAIYYYQQMENTAHLLQDDTLLNIALTYHGDMLRRKGDMEGAITYLEAALNTTPQADIAAQGNAFQLLGRVYLRTGKVNEFEYALKEAEELAYEVNQTRSSVRQYNLSFVYEEYAKSYGSLGKVQKALDYVDLAEKMRAPTKSSEMLMKVARAEILIRNGDIREGEPLAIEAAIHSRKYGHQRRLERIFALKRYLNQQVQRLSKVEMALSEALEGPIEY